MDKPTEINLACKETGIDIKAIEKATDYIDTRLGNRFEWGKSFVLGGKSCPMISVGLHPLTPIKIDKILTHVFKEFKLTMEVANCKKEKGDTKDTKDYYWIDLNLRWEHGGGGSNGHDLDFVLLYDVESKQLTEKDHTGL